MSWDEIDTKVENLRFAMALSKMQYIEKNNTETGVDKFIQRKFSNSWKKIFSEQISEIANNLSNK